MGVALLTPGVIFTFASSRDLASGGQGVGLQNPRSGRILMATGTIVIAAGLAGMGVSGHGLRVAKRELREIERRPPATALRFGPAGVTLRHRF